MITDQIIKLLVVNPPQKMVNDSQSGQCCLEMNESLMIQRSTNLLEHLLLPDFFGADKMLMWIWLTWWLHWKPKHSHQNGTGVKYICWLLYICTFLLYEFGPGRHPHTPLEQTQVGWWSGRALQPWYRSELSYVVQISYVLYQLKCLARCDGQLVFLRNVLFFSLKH